jgi:hypothetical protein
LANRKPNVSEKDLILPTFNPFKTINMNILVLEEKNGSGAVSKLIRELKKQFILMNSRKYFRQ